MAEFTIKIAEHSIGVCSLFDSTRDYCRAYLTEEVPEVTVSVAREDLSFEQEALRQEALEEGIRFRQFSDPFLERTAIQRKVAEFLFDYGILMLHGSTVALDGKAYLFTARCGTGKSTHTRLWRQVFGDRAVMINDDKPFLKVEDHRVTAYGSPWSGKHGLDTNLAVPLQGICILERGTDNQIWKITPEEALPMLLYQSYCPLTGEKHPQFQFLAEQLARNTGLWKMYCNKDPQAAMIAAEAMSK